MKIADIKKTFEKRGYKLKKLPNGKVAFYTRRGKHTLTYDSYAKAYKDLYLSGMIK